MGNSCSGCGGKTVTKELHDPNTPRRTPVGAASDGEVRTTDLKNVLLDFNAPCETNTREARIAEWLKSEKKSVESNDGAASPRRINKVHPAVELETVVKVDAMAPSVAHRPSASQAAAAFAPAEASPQREVHAEAEAPEAAQAPAAVQAPSQAQAPAAAESPAAEQLLMEDQAPVGPPAEAEAQPSAEEEVAAAGAPLGAEPASEPRSEAQAAAVTSTTREAPAVVNDEEAGDAAVGESESALMTEVTQATTGSSVHVGEAEDATAAAAAAAAAAAPAPTALVFQQSAAAPETLLPYLNGAAAASSSAGVAAAAGARPPSRRMSAEAAEESTKLSVRMSMSVAALHKHSLKGNLNYKDLHGWRTAGLVDAMAARLSDLSDLPLEDATPKEESQIEELKAALLRKLGLQSVPTGWRSQHFSRRRLLAYLRARSGDLNKALERAVECTVFLDGVVDMAKKYEEAPESHKNVADQLMHSGQFGLDKRGASVTYMQFSKTDTAGIIKQTSFDFYLNFDWYNTLFFWDTLAKESDAAGVALNGRMLVADVSGASINKIRAALDIGKKMMATWPAKEHPMPEGFNRTIVCNVPWVAAQFWGTAKRFFPKRDADRVKLFTSGEHAQFVKELLKHVDKEQVPLWIGGESTEPWPYGKSLDPLLPPWPHNPLDTLAEKTTLGSFARRVSESSYRGMHGAVDTLKHAAALPVEGMKHVHIPHPHVHLHISGGHATHAHDTRDKSK